jgi:AAA+ superfamily predicted ATPase
MTGTAGSGRRATLAAAAASLGTRPSALTSQGFHVMRRRCATWAGACVARPRWPMRWWCWWASTVGRPAPTSRSTARCSPSTPPPLAATSGRIEGRPPSFDRGSVLVQLAAPSEAAREVLWRRFLPPEAPPAVARWAAERYRLTPGIIRSAATAATRRANEACARGGLPAELTGPDLHDAVRGVLDAKLTTLGTRLAWRQTWDDLVLPDDAVDDIVEFVSRVRHRRLVYETWGMARKVAKGMGLSALFSGPPGTGKTMVAGLIAQELGLDLYQIDLSKVVSKWIGETEKNLGELFDAAEAGHALLLFDEADSLFAKRTQVNTSNDRYANLEVNYLLQRLEAFTGIVILTTNHDTTIDDAFRRRLSLRIEFAMPAPPERERIWRAMLTEGPALAPDLDLASLAHRFEMSGGYIRNAALRAAFLAANDGTPITMPHLLRAARAEYQAMGKVVAHL